MPVGGALHGVEGKARAQQIAADTLETLAVAAVDGDGGVQLPSTVTAACSGRPSWTQATMALPTERAA